MKQKFMNREISQCPPSREFLNLLSKFTTLEIKKQVSHIDLMRLYSRMHNNTIHQYQHLLGVISAETAPRMLLKYLYLVHGCIQYHDYERRLCELLQDTSFPQLHITDKVDQWLSEVCQGYFKYLIKVCLNHELYSNLSIGKVSPKTAVTNIFVIINLFNVYLAQAKQTFNSAGRYYFKTLFQFQDMYDILRKELENMYQYMKVLIDRVVSTHTSYSKEEMGCFLEAMIEVDLLNDQFEELSKNKYYSSYQSVTLYTLSTSDQQKLIQYVLNQ